ncbi:hypothetical protein QL285_075708 [Trifolium repens]|nr:hypothetical protein QL285_075708 [Trifolium repens]
MSQSPKQTSPSTTNSPQPQPSDVITDVVPISVVPLTIIHPSFASALKSTTSEPSSKTPSTSTKSKPQKKTKAKNTRATKTSSKPKSQKPESRYSSNFNMQQLYLDDQGTASTNVASDVATSGSNVEIATAEGISPKSLNFEKGEIAVESEKVNNVVPESPGNNGNDEDHEELKEAEDTLKSLAKADPKANVVPDVPTSLAQSPPMSAVGEDIEDDVDHVVEDSPMQQEKDGSDNVHTDNVTTVWQVYQSVVE